MSDANRTAVEAVIEAVNRRDFAALDAAGWLHPELEFESRMSTSEGTFHGIDGLRQWAVVVDETWAGYRIEVLDLTPVGPDRALVLFHITGAGRGSGVPLDVRAAQVWEWRDGRLWRGTAYETEEAARVAAGRTAVAVLVDAFNDREIDRLVELSHPQVEISALRSALEGTYAGHDGLRRWASELLDLADDYRIDLRDARPVSGNAVLVRGRQTGRPPEGPRIDSPLLARMEFEDGLLRRVETFREDDQDR